MVVGSRALDDILPAMLEQLGDPDMHENAQDSLRQIMAIKSWAVLPYLIPKLIVSPVNTSLSHTALRMRLWSWAITGPWCWIQKDVVSFCFSQTVETNLANTRFDYGEKNQEEVKVK